MNDKSDDEIMQDLAIACQRFRERFGSDDLVDALQDLIDTIQNGDAVEQVPFQ